MGHPMQDDPIRTPHRSCQRQRPCRTKVDRVDRPSLGHGAHQLPAQQLERLAHNLLSLSHPPARLTADFRGQHFQQRRLPHRILPDLPDHDPRHAFVPCVRRLPTHRLRSVETDPLHLIHSRSRFPTLHDLAVGRRPVPVGPMPPVERHTQNQLRTRHSHRPQLPNVRQCSVKRGMRTRLIVGHQLDEIRRLAHERRQLLPPGHRHRKRQPSRLQHAPQLQHQQSVAPFLDGTRRVLPVQIDAVQLEIHAGPLNRLRERHPQGWRRRHLAEMPGTAPPTHGQMQPDLLLLPERLKFGPRNPLQPRQVQSAFRCRLRRKHDQVRQRRGRLGVKPGHPIIREVSHDPERSLGRGRGTLRPQEAESNQAQQKNTPQRSRTRHSQP